MNKIVAALLASIAFLIPAVSSAANLSNLNGLTTATQTFATSTATSSHLRIQSSGSVHTFLWDGTPWTLAQGGTGTTTFATSSIPFINNGRFSANPAQLFWDAVNNILNIGGTTTPAAKLSVRGSGSLDLFNVASSTGTSLLFVSSAGNVGIGTTTPFEKLEVVGNGKFSGFLQSNTLTILGTSTLIGRVGIGTTSPRSALDIFGAFYSQLVTANGSNIDWNAGNVQSLALTSNPTLTFSNGQAGGEYKLILNQDAIGGRTVGWPGSVKWLLGSAPTLATSSNSTDIVKFVYDGTNYLGFSAVARSVAPPPPSSLLSGLLSYWRFDESSGNAADSSGNGKTLTNVNSATFTPGKGGLGNAATLVRASSQYFTRSNGTYYDVTGGTLNCWVKWNTNPSVLSIVSYSTNSGASGLDFRVKEANVLHGYMGAGANAVFGATALSSGTWYMATYTWNTGGKKVFLNGMENGTSTVAETMTAGNTNFYLGIRSDLNEPFDGMIDECGIWNRVLSPSEITALYNNGDGLQYPF